MIIVGASCGSRSHLATPGTDGGAWLSVIFERVKSSSQLYGRRMRPMGTRKSESFCERRPTTWREKARKLSFCPLQAGV